MDQSLQALGQRLREIYPDLADDATLTPSQIDQAIATLRDETAERTRPIRSAELLAWAGQAGRAARIRGAANDEQLSDEVRSVAIAADVMIRRDGTDLDLERDDRQQMLDVLVQASILTNDDQTALHALSKHQVRRWDRLGVDRIKRAWEVTRG